MTFEEAKNFVLKDYPNSEVAISFEFKGAWYISLKDDGFHAVDPNSGAVTGSLPIMILLENEAFAKAFENATNSNIEHALNDEFLAHHGIKGQKWGVRRFQEMNGKLTPAGVERYRKGNGKEKQGNIYSDSAYQILIQTVPPPLNLAVMAAHYSKKAVQAGIAHHNKKQGDKILYKKGIVDESRTLSSQDPPRLISGEHSAEQDSAKVNDLYSNLRPQTTNNCALCSATMEARRRGFDVCARTNSVGVNTEELLKKSFVPPPKPDQLMEPSPVTMRSTLKKSLGSERGDFKLVENAMLEKYPEGSRGILTAANKHAPIGHAVAFEIKNGKVIIYDTQSNKKFDLSKKSAFTKYFVPDTSTAYRLDDKKINWDEMNGICAERKKVS